MKRLTVQQNQNATSRKQPTEKANKAPSPLAKHENLRYSRCAEDETAELRALSSKKSDTPADGENRV